MKFTVLGASGFIGSRLAAHLRGAGHECCTPQRDAAPPRSTTLGHAIYCIGLTADFRQRPYETMRAHVCRLADVLETCDFDSLLYLSSTRVYQGATDTHEDAPLSVNPNTPGDLYNLSKLAGEALCLSCGRERVRVARLSNVVGGDLSSQNFLAQVLRAALEHGHVQLQTTLDSGKDYIGIDDVVGILPRIAISGRDRLYNVASGLNLSNRELMEPIRALTGCTVSVAADAVAVSFPPIRVKRLSDEFRFTATSPSTHLNTWIAATRSERRPT